MFRFVAYRRRRVFRFAVLRRGDLRFVVLRRELFRVDLRFADLRFLAMCPTSSQERCDPIRTTHTKKHFIMSARTACEG